MMMKFTATVLLPSFIVLLSALAGQPEEVATSSYANRGGLVHQNSTILNNIVHRELEDKCEPNDNAKKRYITFAAVKFSGKLADRDLGDFLEKGFKSVYNDLVDCDQKGAKRKVVDTKLLTIDQRRKGGKFLLAVLFNCNACSGTKCIKNKLFDKKEEDDDEYHDKDTCDCPGPTSRDVAESFSELLSKKDVSIEDVSQPCLDKDCSGGDDRKYKKETTFNKDFVCLSTYDYDYLFYVPKPAPKPVHKPVQKPSPRSGHKPSGHKPVGHKPTPKPTPKPTYPPHPTPYPTTPYPTTPKPTPNPTTPKPTPNPTTPKPTPTPKPTFKCLGGSKRRALCGVDTMPTDTPTMDGDSTMAGASVLVEDTTAAPTVLVEEDTMAPTPTPVAPPVAPLVAPPVAAPVGPPVAFSGASTGAAPTGVAPVAPPPSPVATPGGAPPPGASPPVASPPVAPPVA